jgi:hypothetical protein
VSAGEIISLLVNLGVGLYFAVFYPRQVRRRLGSGPLPPFFAIITPVVRVVGYLVLGGTAIYAAFRLTGQSI